MHKATACHNIRQSDLLGIQEDRGLPEPLAELTSPRSHFACVSPKLHGWNEANEKSLQKIGFLSSHEGRVPFSLSGKLPLCSEETLVSPVGAAVSDAGWLLYFLAKPSVDWLC